MRTFDALSDDALEQLDELHTALQAHPSRFAPGAYETITRLFRNLKKEQFVSVSLTERLIINQLHNQYIERVTLTDELLQAA